MNLESPFGELVGERGSRVHLVGDDHMIGGNNRGRVVHRVANRFLVDDIDTGAGDERDVVLTSLMERAPSTRVGHLDSEIGSLLEHSHVPAPLGKKLSNLHAHETTSDDHNVVAERHPTLRQTSDPLRGCEMEPLSSLHCEPLPGRQTTKRRPVSAGKHHSKIISGQHMIEFGPRNGGAPAMRPGGNDNRIEGRGLNLVS